MGEDELIPFHAESVLRRAADYGKPGSEAYLRAIARESLIKADLDLQWMPELPTRDEVIATTLADAEGLILFDIKLIWAICRAMALNDVSWRAALVLPFHTLQKRYYVHSTPKLGAEHESEDDDFYPTAESGEHAEEYVEVRSLGSKEVDIEDWRSFEWKVDWFTQIFSAALSRVTDKFVGMVQTADELRDLAGDGPVGQVRIMERTARGCFFDPVGELQAFDSLWAAERELGHRTIDIIAWQYHEANVMGYDLGHLRGDPEHLSGLETWNLREVIQLPEWEQTLLFVWDAAYSGPVEMTCMRDNSESTVAVPLEELRFRLDFTPSHYSYDVPDVRMVALGTLTKKIQRGTSLNGKSLDIIGTVSDPRPGAWFDLDTFTLFSESDFYYVDNASISQNSVRPRVISEIPAGQERYTLLPEDGTVVLVARNGKGSACYTAKRPTLVSNNLFIIWPDHEKAVPEYLSCALRSTYVRGQMNAICMPMGKAELEHLLIPVGPGRLMDAVVKREKQIEREIKDLDYRLDLLRHEEPLDQLWAKEGEEGRPPAGSEHKLWMRRRMAADVEEDATAPTD